LTKVSLGFLGTSNLSPFDDEPTPASVTVVGFSRESSPGSAGYVRLITIAWARRRLKITFNSSEY
jgi:hypothetical protein